MNKFRIPCLALFVFFASIQSGISQEIKTFQGNFENGTATYQYFENTNLEKIFQGNFKYKGSVAGGMKGKSNLSITGQYINNKKDGKWTYSLIDPDFKGTTEVVTGAYVNGSMEGPWSSIVTSNNTKKIVRKTTASFKGNKLIGELKFDYTVNNLKDFSVISVQGFFNDSSFFDGSWETTYTQANVKYQETRKYRNGVLYWLLPLAKRSLQLRFIIHVVFNYNLML